MVGCMQEQEEPIRLSESAEPSEEERSEVVERVPSPFYLSIVPLLERGSSLYLSILPPLYLYIVPLHNILFHRNSQAMVEAVSAVFRVICTLLHCVVSVVV